MKLSNWTGTQVALAAITWVLTVSTVLRVVRDPLVAAFTARFLVPATTTDQATRAAMLFAAALCALLAGPALAIWLAWRAARRSPGAGERARAA